MNLSSIWSPRRLQVPSVLAGLAMAVVPAGAEEASPYSRFDGVLQQIEARLTAARDEVSTLARIPDDQTGERTGYHSRILQGGRHDDLWVQIDLGQSREFDAVLLVPVVLPREQGGTAGYGFPRRFEVSTSEEAGFSSPTVLADETQEDLPNPGREPLLYSCRGARGRYVRLTATGPTGRLTPKGVVNWPSLALAEFMVLKGDRNLAAGREVSAPTSREAPPVWSLRNLTDGESILGAPVGASQTPRKGWHSIAYPEADTPVSVTLDLGAPLPLEDVRLFPMRWEGFPHWLGFGFPVRYKVQGAVDAEFANPVTIADHTLQDAPNPGMNAVVLPADGLQARYIRVTATRQWERFTDHAFALSEIQVFSNGVNAARQAVVEATSTYPDQPWAAMNLVDGDASDNPIIPIPDWIAQLRAASRLEHEIAGLELARQTRLAYWDRLMARTSIGGGTFVLATLAAFLVRNTLRRRRELRALQQRIARDLHDEVGSNLAGISLLSREASQTASPPHRRQLMEEVCRVADETAAAMRDLVWMVQPGAPGDLMSGLRLCAARLLGGLQVQFQPPEEPLPANMPLDFKRELFLIYKEALQNISRHSGARSVVISFTRERRMLVVRIRDNGRGLGGDASTTSTGHGLENMKHRARGLRGEVRLHSPPEGGCEVEIRLPWPG